MSNREIEFREGLLAHHGALEDLRGLLLEHLDSALPSVQRLARSVQDLARGPRKEKLEKAAAALAEADRENIGSRLEELQSLLRDGLAASTRQRVRLVIVHGDATEAKILQSALSAVHREVVLAADGATAEQLAARHAFGLIVLGLTLPDVDGRDLLMRFRAKAKTRSTPIFIVAPELDRATAIECLALGADRCLATPVDPNEFAAAVTAQLHVSQATERRELRDPLTGLANVAGFNEAFDRLSAFCRRSGNPLSLGLIELVGLPEINEREGHDAGDACLVHTATLIRHCLRQSDLAARWDGDAFVVALPNTLVEGAVVALKKIRDLLRASNATTPAGTAVALDCSAGVADVADADRTGDAVAKADRVLHYSRRAGPGTILSTTDPLGTDSNVVLLIEDDPVSAAVVRHRLARDGFDVRHFVDGEEALEAAQELDAALVLLDVKLPGMDGFELLRRLRESERFARVPIAMVSALTREEDIVRGLELGADDYISKPFSTNELRARVQRMLQERGIAYPDAPETTVAKNGA